MWLVGLQQKEAEKKKVNWIKEYLAVLELFDFEYWINDPSNHRIYEIVFMANCKGVLGRVQAFTFI